MGEARRHPLIPRREVDPQQQLPALELEILERWRARDVFAESLRRRAGAERWVFYEGPPTANGPPGTHHVLSRVFKDIYPRFQTMRGRYVERKGGWDCHGLPVEIAVEEKLGITSKMQIEQDVGIERFNAECRASVFEYLEDWNRLTERIGFWLDLEGAYRTLDETYVESVWWALSEIHARGLLYEGHKVVPYCPRCETTLSSHEVALGYRDVVDPSVYLKLPVHDGPERLLVWTTTPWTLPGNVAVAVSPRATYVRAAVDGEVLVLAEARVEAVLGGDRTKVLERFTGEELVERYGSYHGPIFAATDRKAGPLPILADDFVTTEDGTGIVHLAPAFGEDDYRVAAASPRVPFDPSVAGSLYNPVRPDGTFDERVLSRDGSSYGGRFVKDERLTADLLDDLGERGLVLKVEDYEHAYPHCWRSDNALIYYAKPSWYISTSRLRSELLEANETVDWHPPHVKHGRFGDWLANNVDWALSRERYWGTPLPVWRCPRGHVRVIGSYAELQRLTGTELVDHHRPYVDELGFPCEADDGASGVCGEPMRRVPEVIDVWFDSGAMPFAQHHHPFEHDELFRESYPAQFICEAQDQTRGWFYSLLAIAVLLGRRAPYENVVCLGLILDEQGQKMSKSRGNAVEPWEVLDAYGADALRWYFFTAKQPWDGYRFLAETIGEGVRLFLKQLWSTYYFYALYAHAAAATLQDAPEPAEPPAAGGNGSGAPLEDLDRWALSRTAATAELVAERLEAYDATSAGRAVAALVEDLSNWYVRRSRRRFWDGEAAAFTTLRSCLLAVSRMLAPLCPFIADEIYDNLDGTLPSVHLCDFPTPAEIGPREPELEEAMALARETVRLGLGARAKAKIKVRQPLREAVVVADGRERSAIERLAEVVREELNVASIRFVAAAGELGSYEVKANYRSLGPLFGKQMPLAAAAIAALEPSHVAEAVRDGAGVGIDVGGREHTLTAEDLILTMRAPEGYSVEREGAHAVALDLNLDEQLRREGLAREVVHAVQNARKAAGLQVEDRISLWLDGDAEVLAAAEAHHDYVAGETLAVDLTIAAATASGAAATASGGAATASGGAATASGGADADGPPAGTYRGEAAVEEMRLGISLTRAPRA
ncbi:MAG TPA: isoleucine--tRNA ligase [Solirubrobacteraceae bacterium]|nr:isoleucine--tRNA ligase [Solirubrobacteraceae bacterium]